MITVAGQRAPLLLGVLLAFAMTAPLTGRAQSLTVDRTTPIEITADDFEVRPQEEKGIFSGNVRVIQGQLTLAADRMDVTYDGASTSGQSIQSLRATGNVRITTPDEQATGGWARYDVAGRTMELGGGVLLTRGPNVLEGARLTIDLETRQSRLLPNAPGEDPAGPDTPGSGRVRAVFTPPPPKEDGTD
ncbi:MAG: LptA/OstA family protein [Alphaproteobacteria bacterium]